MRLVCFYFYFIITLLLLRRRSLFTIDHSVSQVVFFVSSPLWDSWLEVDTDNLRVFCNFVSCVVSVKMTGLPFFLYCFSLSFSLFYSFKFCTMFKSDRIICSKPCIYCWYCWGGVYL
jgi:hypothetical protein